jgi:riboflavin synthase
MFTGIVRELGTVEAFDGSRLVVGAPETAATAALRVGDPLGGHVVQGHVDAVGRVRSVTPEGDGRRVWVDAPETVVRYCIEKGSIAVDGASLTIAAFDDDGFEVALIPHTLAVTTLGGLEPGDEVNLEADVLGKVVERLLAARLS